MTDESYSFSTARVRLEEIVTQVRKKDTSLEKSLDLLEEGVRLANACTELIDHADWTAGDAPAKTDASEESLGEGVVAEGALESQVGDFVSEGDASVGAGADNVDTSDGAADSDDDFDGADEAWTDEADA